MIESFVDYVLNMVRFFGPLGLILAMVIQAIIAIIPSEGVLFVSGMSLSLFQSTFFGGIGELLGATASFFIASKFGRPIVLRLISKEDIELADRFMKKFGSYAVFTGRLLPFVPFDAVSYVSGLTSISFGKFMAATAVGAFPRAFFYSYLGFLTSQKLATEGLESTFYFLSTITVVFILLLFAGKHWMDKHVKH